MINGLTINTPSNIQNSGSNGQIQSIQKQITLLERQKEQIEKDDTLSRDSKAKKTQAIQNQIDMLNEQLANTQKKQEHSQKEQSLSDEQRKLENTMDPEAAKLALILQELLVNATAADTSDESQITDADDINDINGIIDTNGINDISDIDNQKDRLHILSKVKKGLIVDTRV